MEFTYKAIGTLVTPFREKFGIPRQSLMMEEARGHIKLNPDPQFALALKHLEQFSHIWVIFDFHKNGRGPWHPLIDTPRLEAGHRMGVFATRSPHRPNALGMSAVKLESIDYSPRDGIEIHINGVDIMDGTPVLDIKPYLPFADRIEEANSGWAQSDIKKFTVSFSEESLHEITAQRERHPRLYELILEMLSYDPRPTSQRRASPIDAEESQGLRFAFRLLDLDIRWEIKNFGLHVFEVMDLKSTYIVFPKEARDEAPVSTELTVPAGQNQVP